MAQTTAEKTGAEDVRWDLSELFSSPEDPAIERILAESLEFAKSFEERYKGRIAELSPPEFTAMMQELEANYITSTKPTLYAHLCAAMMVDTQRGRLPLSSAPAMPREADRELRESTSHGITEALRQDLRTRTYIFNVLLQEKTIVDRLRKYPSWISSRNLAN